MIRSEPKFIVGQLVYYREGGRIRSGQIKQYGYYKDNVRDENGEIVAHNLISPFYFVNGQRYDEDVLKESIEELL